MNVGMCRCLPGWVGDDCSKPCPQGKYGFNCTQSCQCMHGNTCRPNDGVCRCPPGWMGPRCSESCPEGYYGENCYLQCQCKSENFVCDPVKGCLRLGIPRVQSITYHAVEFVTLLLMNASTQITRTRLIRETSTATEFTMTDTEYPTRESVSH